MSIKERLLEIARFPFTLEASFVLFLFAGRLKGDPRLAWVPVDLTALFFATSIVAAFIIQLRRGTLVSRTGAMVVVAMLGFVSWLAMTLLWSPSAAYGFQKVAYMATLVLWAVVVSGLFIGPSRERMARFLVALLLFGLWSAFEMTVKIRSEGFGYFLSVFGADPIVVSSTLCLTFLIVFVRTLYARRSAPRVLLGGAIMLWLVTLMLASGGRGPILALMAAILMFCIAIMVRRFPPRAMATKARRRVVITIGVAAATVVMALPALIESGAFITLRRFQTLFGQEGGGESANSRVVLTREALAQWSASPIVGRGAGSFGMLRGGVDMRAYSHNIFSEILGESGLVGLALFAAIVAAAVGFARWRTLFYDELMVSAVLIFLFALVSAQFSGDLPDNRMVFMALALIAAIQPAESAPAPIAAPTT